MTANGGSHSYYEAHSTRSILAGIVRMGAVKVEARIIVDPDVDGTLTQRQRDAAVARAVTAARTLANQFTTLTTPKTTGTADE